MRGERFNTVFEALYDDPAEAAKMQARAEAIIAQEQAIAWCLLLAAFANRDAIPPHLPELGSDAE
jgi:hypothetical protein